MYLCTRTSDISIYLCIHNGHKHSSNSKRVSYDRFIVCARVSMLCVSGRVCICIYVLLSSLTAMTHLPSSSSSSSLHNHHSRA